MERYYQDNHSTLYNQDFRKNDLPDESIQCVVTSPPYWGLRKYSGEQELIWGGDKDCEHEWVGAGDVSDVRKDVIVAGKSRTEERFYGGDETRKFNGQHQKHYQDNTCSLCGAWKGAYGLEPTPELYVQHTVEILREIRRVLRKDGVVFWNIGDSYSGSGKGIGSDHGKGVFTDNDIVKTEWGNRKPKDLCLIPFRVAIAAQEDGWWVRSIIIWSKPNPMPESVTDRPTESHEYILLLTKSSRYYWDADAVREQQTGNAHSRGSENGNAAYQAARGSYKDFKSPVVDLAAGRNLRSVWEFPTQPYPEAHFAVFPEKLPETCIKAATPEVGCCSKCGAPWERITETKVRYRRQKSENEKYPIKPIDGEPGIDRRFDHDYEADRLTLGWQPTCKCNADKVPSVVLDPFAGTGTTLWVAKKLNRKAVGYEISEEYCQLTVERLRQQVML